MKKIRRALAALEFYKAVPLQIRGRIYDARKRCYRLITGEELRDDSLRAGVVVFIGRNRRKLIAASFAAVLALAGTVVYVSMLRPSGNPPFIVYVSGTVHILRNGIEVQPSIKSIIGARDTVETGDDGTLIVQCQDGTTALFERGSRSVIESFADQRSRLIALEKGSVISRVAHRKGGTGYAVRTPIASATARGTEFLVEHLDGSTLVAVSKGTVFVEQMSGAAAGIAVEEGNSFVISQDTKSRALSEDEKKRLRRLEQVPEAKDLKKMSPEEIRKLFKDAGDENGKKGNVKTTSIEELRKQYSRIDTLTLYNGRKISGVILSRGRYIRVLAPSGEMAVPAKDVRFITVE